MNQFFNLYVNNSSAVNQSLNSGFGLLLTAASEGCKKYALSSRFFGTHSPLRDDDSVEMLLAMLRRHIREQTMNALRGSKLTAEVSVSIDNETITVHCNGIRPSDELTGNQCA